MNNFAVFILTHGRPDNIITYDNLIKQGYTGKIYIVIDNEDKSADRYYNLFGDMVVMFDKEKISKTFDEADNFKDRRSIVYARNACFDIAENLGIEYFLQLDDDYTSFDFRLYIDGEAVFTPIKNLDNVFEKTLDYYKSTTLTAIAYSQGGDFIGGIDNGKEIFRFNKRKAMNTFFCSTLRRFNFIGRINEDVNSYTYSQSIGLSFLTIANASITQKGTQKTKGGMSDIYLNQGTYIKSFYTILFSPSCVKIREMNSSHKRLHHSISWDNAVPKIINSKHKKVVKNG